MSKKLNTLSNTTFNSGAGLPPLETTLFRENERLEIELINARAHIMTLTKELSELKETVELCYTEIKNEREHSKELEDLI